MNRKLLFMVFGVFLFLILFCVPAKAEDVMSWSPRTFAGGGFASYGELLNAAIAIRYGPEVLYEFAYKYKHDEVITSYSTTQMFDSKGKLTSEYKTEEVLWYDYSQD